MSVSMRVTPADSGLKKTRMYYVRHVGMRLLALFISISRQLSDILNCRAPYCTCPFPPLHLAKWPREDMATIFELLTAPLTIFEGIGLSPFQAFVVIGMLSSGAIMNWTYNFNNHDDDDDDSHHE